MSKTALVLSGGGAKGAYQIGVIQQLFAKGFTPDCVYGTSVGALNGAAIAYRSVNEVVEEWLSIKGSEDVLDFNWKIVTGMSDGLYNMKPLRETFIDSSITGPFKFAVKVCRVNLNTGATEFVCNEDVNQTYFKDAVQDSATIPLAMVPRDIYVDGGVREVIPLEKAINDGAKEIVVILCNPWSKNPIEKWDYLNQNKFLRMIKLAVRITDGIMNHEVKENDIKSVLHKIDGIKITVYAPDEYLYDTLEFNPTKIRNAIELGLIAKGKDLLEFLKGH